MCASAEDLLTDPSAVLAAARRAVGARTLVLARFAESGSTVDAVGADQRGLAIWCEKTCAALDLASRADPEAARAHFARTLPDGVAVHLLPGLPVPGVVAARGFRAREARDRSRQALAVVADLLGLAVARRVADLARERADRRDLVMKRLVTETRTHLDIDAVFRAIAASVSDAIELSRFSVVIADVSDRAYRRAVSFDGRGNRISRGTVPVSRSVGLALGDGKTRVNGDIRDSEDPNCRELVRRGIVSTIVAPLIVDGRAVGTLNVGSERPQAYSVGDGVRVQQLADDVAELVAAALAATSADQSENQQLRSTASERLESIGRLAAGVAHEVNNPLAVVLSNLQTIAEQDRTPGGEIDDMLSESIVAVERIADVVRALRDYAQNDAPGLSNVDPVAAVRNAVRMVENQVGLRARLDLDLEPTPSVFGDAAELTQVVMRLLSRSADGLSPNTRARNRIRVRTRVSEGVVRIVIRDNGPGLSGSQLERLFDASPGPAEGAPPSLAPTAEIARRFGGQIDVRTDERVGTRFELTLPVQSNVLPRRSTLPPSAFRSRLRGRVLLIDDEPAVLRAFSRILRVKHEVVAVSGGAEALRLLAEDQQFDAILCDVMMPDVDGPAVLDAVKTKWPGLAGRVVLCTGGEFTARAKRFLDQVESPVLQKPVDADELREAVGRVVGLSQQVLREPHEKRWGD